MKTNCNNQLHKSSKDYRHSKVVSVIAILLLGILSSSTAFGAYWFLGIGNDGYISDVDGLYNSLMSTQSWQETQVYSRIISDHGGSQIIDDLAWLGNAQSGDLAIFYYSGHGGFLSDYSGEELAGWAMDSFDETIGYSYDQCRDDHISNTLNIINPAVSLVTIFDSCYSGGMVGGLDDLNALPNVYALLSSREDQESYSIIGDEFSLFTGGLIAGLGPGMPADLDSDGVLWSDEWFSYSVQHIPTLPLGYEQNPVYWAAPGLERVAIVIPEPATIALLGIGSLVLLHRNRIGVK